MVIILIYNCLLTTFYNELFYSAFVYLPMDHLMGLGHEIRIRFKWYGLIGLGLEKVRQIFIIFLIVPLILNWINKFLTI